MSVRLLIFLIQGKWLTFGWHFKLIFTASIQSAKSDVGIGDVVLSRGKKFKIISFLEDSAVVCWDTVSGEMVGRYSSLWPLLRTLSYKKRVRQIHGCQSRRKNIQ